MVRLVKKFFINIWRHNAMISEKRRMEWLVRTPIFLDYNFDGLHQRRSFKRACLRLSPSLFYLTNEISVNNRVQKELVYFIVFDSSEVQIQSKCLIVQKFKKTLSNYLLSKSSKAWYIAIKIRNKLNGRWKHNVITVIF